MHAGTLPASRGLWATMAFLALACAVGILAFGQRPLAMAVPAALALGLVLGRSSREGHGAEEIAEVEGFNLQLAERVQRFLTAQSAEAEAHEAAEGGAELDGGAPPEAGPGNGTLLRDRDDVAFDAAAAELDAIEEEEAPPPEPIDAETPPSN